MKPLTLAQPTVMFIIGIPGAGKSFFASRFSETFGAPLVCYDRLRYEMLAEPQYTTEEIELVNRIATYQIEELLKSKRSFMVDGGAGSRAERSQLTMLAKRAGYDTLIIWVQTDEAIAKRRSLGRNPQREGDKYNVSMTPEQFSLVAHRFTPPLRENSMVISGMHTYGTQAKAVLRKLVAQRSLAVPAEPAAIPPRTDQPHLQRPERPSGPTRRSLIIR
jgi:predicted kinase